MQWGTTYHQKVVKKEDFSLVQSKFLGLIWVWNLEEPAVADQTPVRQREHLCREGKSSPQPPDPPVRAGRHRTSLVC